MGLDMKAIGARIRRQREFLGYSREQLAELLEITPKFCSDIELGVKGMSLHTLDAVCNKLKLSADYILYGGKEHEEGDLTEMLYEMFAACRSPEKKYAIDIMKIFLMAVDHNGG